MKKLILLSLMVCLLMPSTSFAQEPTNSSPSYQEYIQGQEDGWIGLDVTYDDFKKLTDESEMLEKQLGNPVNFAKIYDSVLNPLAIVPTLNPGDVIITNSTSSAGLTGHNAIALSENEILHIRNVSSVPEIQTRAAFNADYNKPGKWVQVYRMNDYYAGANAAIWADNTYRYSNAKYKITTDITTTHETYCSKLVFQAYYYGVGRSKIYPGFDETNGFPLLPYDLTYYLSQGDYTTEYHGDL